jgi:hypothetical protein
MRALRLLLLAGLACSAFARAEDARVLEAGTDPSAWHALASDDVGATLRPEGPPTIDFDFHRRAGYVGLERPLAIDWPEDFDLRIDLAGEVSGNDLELKFIDASGDNVWWYRLERVRLQGPATLHVTRRQVEWAWGPGADHRLLRTARLQLVVSARAGGQGTLAVRGASLEPRVPLPAVLPAPVAREGLRAVAVPDGEAGHAWQCVTQPCTLELDFGVRRPFDGLRLAWAPGARPALYAVRALTPAPDGARVAAGARELLALVKAEGPAADWLYTPGAEAQRLAIDVLEGQGTLNAVGVTAAGAHPDLNRLVAAAAAEAPRGHYPRGFTAQAAWTLIGTDNGHHSALLSADGALEPGVGAAALEPFVIEDGRVVTWADVDRAVALEGGDLPMPTVTWHAPRWTLETAAFADADRGERLWARYRLSNTSAAPLSLRLVLALRPFQVNPPAQFLNTPGGVAPLSNLAWRRGALVADGTTPIVPLRAPDGVALAAEPVQLVPALLAEPDRYQGAASEIQLLSSPRSSGALAFDLQLAPGEQRDVGVLIPWTAAREVSLAALEQARAHAIATWRARLAPARIEAPDAPEAALLGAALRTATAHLLVSREGGLLRPGTRAYARSWIRDGAMMSAALLRLGETTAPNEYLAAYLPYLYTNGKVPCCVDTRGSDPVPEHDSAGEFLHLAAELWHRGGDRRIVRRAWPGIQGAVAWLDRLRAETEAATGPEADRYRGLLPPSISHEGYSAKPMHSYWDDFWALRGYSDAIALADALGHPGEASRWRASRAAFASAIRASLAEVQARRGVDYIPGAADLGDFDATSTTIALAPGTGGEDLPPAALAATFDRYWDFFQRRRDGQLEWSDYTPYEWRVVGTFVRLGQRERALAALRFFFAARRPEAWNQWPEVVTHDPVTPRFIGDLPHGWVASDFLRSALDLFAYDDEASASLVLGAGLAPEWLEGRGITVHGLVTRAGPLDYTAHSDATGVDVTLGRGLKLAAGGLVLRFPAAREGVALVDGRPVSYHDGALRLPRAPHRIHLPKA